MRPDKAESFCCNTGCGSYRSTSWYPTRWSIFFTLTYPEYNRTLSAPTSRQRFSHDGKLI